jgi:hypothetical protein
MLSQGADGPAAEDSGRNSEREAGAPLPGQKAAPPDQPALGGGSQPNLVGLHITAGSYLTEVRIDGYSASAAARSVGLAESKARATSLLARAVQTQANVLSYIDGFTVVGISTIGCLSSSPCYAHRLQ